jgi:archaellum component FlaG (FlaF/FlaG flagellin family)
MTDKQSRLTDQLKTDIEVVNVLYDSGPSPDREYVFVKNVGTVKISTRCMDLFIDDTYIPLSAADITDPDTGSEVNETDIQDTVRLNGSLDLASDVHEATVVTCNGVTDSFDFST